MTGVASPSVGGRHTPLCASKSAGPLISAQGGVEPDLLLCIRGGAAAQMQCLCSCPASYHCDCAHLLRGASRSVLKVHRVPLLAITPYEALKSSISFTTGSGVVLFILQESTLHLKPAAMLPLAQA